MNPQNSKTSDGRHFRLSNLSMRGRNRAEQRTPTLFAKAVSAGVMALVLAIALLGNLYAPPHSVAAESPPAEPTAGAAYVGHEACSQCHAAESKAWKASHHAHAMQHVTPETV